MSLSKRTLAISVAAVLGVAAVGTYGLVSSAGASQQPAAAPAATPVDVAPVLAKNVAEWDEFSGRIEVRTDCYEFVFNRTTTGEPVGEIV